MKPAFTLPNTPTSRVSYVQRRFLGQPCTPYLTATIIPTPRDNDGLIVVMLSRSVGQSDIRSVQPVQPRQDVTHTHPALHGVAKYATAAEH